MSGTAIASSTTPPASGDLKLVAGVLSKDRKATALFVGLHSDAIYAYAYRRLAPRVDLAEDLVQEVFLIAWESLRDFRGEAPLRSWLMGIARHKVVDHYRQRMRALPCEDIEPAVGSLADELLDQRRMTDRVRRTMTELPGIYSMVLIWRYWEKRSTKEIAAVTGKTEKSVERLLARAREQFRKRWTVA